MKERLVEDWLTRVHERGFEIPFCQTLVAKGFKILRMGHSPFEDGKDIIALSPKGKIHAYQLKSGDLDLGTFERHRPQIDALVVAAVDHPSLEPGRPHSPFFVTTGSVSLPVLNRTRNLNTTWKRTKVGPLVVIGGKELLADFIELSSNFWPADPPSVREFLELYAATGRGDLNKPKLGKFLVEFLTVDKKTPRSQIARRITAANIFVSYLLRPFYDEKDQWSVFSAWVITASHIAWVADRHSLETSEWLPCFELAKTAALSALESLNTEVLDEKALNPQRPELDQFVRARNTIAASALAAWHLIRSLKGPLPPTATEATALVLRLANEGRLWLWGESAVSHFLAVILFIERTTATMEPDRLLMSITGAIAHAHRSTSEAPFPDPYEPVDEILAGLIKAVRKKDHKPSERVYSSYALEPLIHMIVRRMWRQTLGAMWYEIANVSLAAFRAFNPSDLLLWDCDGGEELQKWFDRPQAWRHLQTSSQCNDFSTLPVVLRDYPDFALMFLLVYPHRVSVHLVNLLDRSF